MRSAFKTVCIIICVTMPLILLLMWTSQVGKCKINGTTYDRITCESYGLKGDYEWSVKDEYKTK